MTSQWIEIQPHTLANVQRLIDWIQSEQLEYPPRFRLSQFSNSTYVGLSIVFDLTMSKPEVLELAQRFPEEERQHWPVVDVDTRNHAIVCSSQTASNVAFIPRNNS